MSNLFDLPELKKAPWLSEEKMKYTEQLLYDVEVACSRHFRYLRDNTERNPDVSIDNIPFLELDSLWKKMEDALYLINKYKRDLKILEKIWDATKAVIKKLNTHVITLDELVEYRAYFMSFYITYVSAYGDCTAKVA